MLTAETVADWQSIVEGKSAAKRYFDPDHPLDLLYGGDPGGRPVFIIVTPSEPDEVTVSRDITTTKGQRSDGRWVLTLRLDDGTLFTSFSRLCLDLVARSREARSPKESMETLLRVLDEWKVLLRRYRPRRLDLAKLRGLVAELWYGFTILLADHPASSVAQSWVGPTGAPQDFAFLDGQLCEVKARRPSKRTVEVASVAQLDPKGKPMTLGVVLLDDCSPETVGAITLISLLSHVRSLPKLGFEGRSHVDNHIRELGVDETDTYYADTAFLVLGFQTFDVNLDFPSIRSSTLDGLPVSNVRYDLAVEPLKPHLLEEVTYADEGGPA